MTIKQKRKRINHHREKMRDKVKSHKILKWYSETHITSPIIDGQGIISVMAYAEFDRLSKEEQRKILD